MHVTEPIIKQSTIDFCNKWNVGVELKSYDEYNTYSVDESIYTFYKSPFGSRWGIRWHKSDSNDRTIVISNCTENASKNSDRIVFHELCHSIFEVKPNLIDDIGSPLMALDFKMVLNAKVSNNFSNMTGWFSLSYNKTGASSIEDYFKFYNQELIEQGLLTESGDFTFDRSKVNPKDSWLKN